MPMSLGIGLGLSRWPKGAGSALERAINAWNSAQASERIEWGGRPTFTSSSTSGGGASASGRTFVNTYAVEGIRQDGYIPTIIADVAGVGTSLGWKFKLFRPSGSDYVVVAETEVLTPAGTGSRTFNLTTPLGPCQPGDRLGLWVIGGGTPASIRTTSQTGSGMLWVAGDASTILSTDSVIANFSLNLRATGVPPFFVVTGDSIMEGHNGATDHHALYHGGESGPPAAEPFNQIRALTPTLTYQNYAQGGATWSMTASKAAAIAAIKPKNVLVHCGVNDVIAGTAFSGVEGFMDTFLAGMPVGTKVFMDEVMPWQGGNDTQAALIRDYNANYAIWAAANDVTLISCHDPMAIIRASTGELDDMVVAYRHGTIHLSVPAGVDALAGIIHSALLEYNWS